MTGRRRAVRVRRWAARQDRRLLLAAAHRRTPVADAVFTAASTAANRSVLWLAVAAALSTTGRRDDRTAAASGLLGIAVTATLVNGPLKFLWRRDRPPTDVAPLLPLPRTFSFPSGHAASAFAFATGVTRARPVLGAAVLPAAAAVAYSRVHTGVHYPSDVAVGAGVGAASGVLAARVVHRARANGTHHLDSPALDVPVPREVVLVTSGHAGTADALDDARAALTDAGFTVRADVPVGEPERLRAEIGRAGTPVLVVAAGGDGTVGAAAGAVLATDAVLAVLPLGTSNDVARSLGVPPDPVQAATGLAAARVRAVDAGRVHSAGGPREGTVFLHAATIGLNVTFARLATRRSWRDRFGGLTYPVAAAVAVRHHQPFECTLDVDGQRRAFDVVHLSVSNAPVFGGLLGMRVPGASMTDGLLDVTVVERLSVARLALAVTDTLVGRHEPVRRVHTLRARSLHLRAPDGEAVAVDGEIGGGSPFTFEALPGAVRVAVPGPG